MNDIKTLYNAINSVEIIGTRDLAHKELVDEIAHFPYTNPNNFAKIGFPIKVVDPANGHEYIDLGLPSGTKWANMNLGAESPEDYGDYYAWGEIEPNKASAYTSQNYRFYSGNDNGIYTKYNDTDNKMTLELADDAANIVMGGDWHMPTSAQCAELLDNTTSSWTTNYNETGVAGMIFTSNNNGNSIFFPAAGVVDDEGSQAQGEQFCIWLSSRGSSSWNAWYVGGDSEVCDLNDGDGRYFGTSVRSVLGELNDYNPGHEGGKA